MLPTLLLLACSQQAPVAPAAADPQPSPVEATAPEPTAEPEPSAEPAPAEEPAAEEPVAEEPAPDPPTETPTKGELADGAPCLADDQCVSGVCEGQGCGDENPGACANQLRPCTRDRRPYCGCDGETFFAGGNCPNQRYAHKGPCEQPPE